MSNVTLSKSDIRKQLRTISADEFIKSHTASALLDAAVIVGAKIPEEAKTKQQVYDAIIAGANLPDPALRGKSKIGSPVAAAWKIADEMHAENAGDETRDPPRRKDVVAAMQEAGIAYYTARTQYQAFYTLTNKATRRLADVPVEELPKALQPVVEEAPSDG